jgi:hypothetical protein
MKLTPVELSKEPLRIEVEAGKYDFATQQRAGVPSALARTMNGTQTHDTHGRPQDRDND